VKVSTSNTIDRMEEIFAKSDEERSDREKDLLILFLMNCVPFFKEI
jgi:hypothetical protein